ncbi:TATA box-binding protein-like protein 1 [Trichinella patagoniensis]|uniref:TATA box-binding protein-like protein 1 n=1 Tax=Trichinella patagoniensis TaxID=990121 RepID=A0A0V0ZQV0_9BILA|nr:TATA box-binding protein-like protein 1 [Trichinella patagoniensis]
MKNIEQITIINILEQVNLMFYNLRGVVRLLLSCCFSVTRSFKTQFVQYFQSDHDTKIISVGAGTLNI